MIKEQVIILNLETYLFIKNTLKQCESWLGKDAKYSHSQSNIRIVNINVLNSLSILEQDIEKYKDNCKILVEKLNENEQ